MPPRGAGHNSNICAAMRQFRTTARAYQSSTIIAPLSRFSVISRVYQSSNFIIPRNLFCVIAHQKFESRLVSKNSERPIRLARNYSGASRGRIGRVATSWRSFEEVRAPLSYTGCSGTPTNLAGRRTGPWSGAQKPQIVRRRRISHKRNNGKKVSGKMRLMGFRLLKSWSTWTCKVWMSGSEQGMTDAKISSGRISGNCGFVAKRFRGLLILREPTEDTATT